MQVQYMKPFYTKVTGNKLRLVFAYQYFSILKDSEVFHFIPIEGKEIIIDLDTQQIKNQNEVFVFQKNNRFARLHLYELSFIDSFQEKINEIISNATGKKDVDVPDEVVEIANNLIEEIVAFNKNNLIDKLLDAKDFDGLTKIME